MKYLRVRNWEKWQSYRSDRQQPPWIKVHRRLFSDPNFVSLTASERGQLMCMWILAADRDGKIPADPDMLRKLCMLDEDVRIQTFVDKGFIEDDATVASPRRQGDAPEERRLEKKHTVDADAPTTDFPARPKKDSSGNYSYPEPFERAWSAYPARDGSNPKVGAYSAFRARVARGAVPEQLVTAAQHYQKHCQTREIEGTPFVQQAATFWGPKEPWREFLEPDGANGKRPDSTAPSEIERMRRLKAETLAQRDAHA